MAIIPEDFNIGESPNNSFENLFITGKLNYEFSNDEITVQKLNVTGTSSFASDVTFTGDITLDEITARNANVTGVATVGTGLYLNGKLFDGDGDFGTAGQLLSSDGTDLNWIDASTTSVANANNVGTNVNSGNADNFITFVGASSGNNPIRVDADLKYNPSTNTLSAINIAGSSTAVNLNVTGNLTVDGQFKDGDGNFGTSGQVLSSDGTDTAWINAGSLTAGAAAEGTTTTAPQPLSGRTLSNGLHTKEPKQLENENQILPQSDLSQISPDSLPSLDEQYKKSEKIKKRRESLGSVNLRADEETKKYETEIKKMEDDRADLYSAIVKLKSSIDELNQKGRERLLDAFGSVHEYENHVFSVATPGCWTLLGFLQNISGGRL